MYLAPVSSGNTLLDMSVLLMSLHGGPYRSVRAITFIGDVIAKLFAIGTSSVLDLVNSSRSVLIFLSDP
jgi:hypothetical protein